MNVINRLSADNRRHFSDRMLQSAPSAMITLARLANLVSLIAGETYGADSGVFDGEHLGVLNAAGNKWRVQSPADV